MILGALVLAAGRSSRFGDDKRAHPMQSGRTLLGTTVTIYQQHFAELRIVIRPDDPPDAEFLRRFNFVLRSQDKLLRAADAALGMGHSLAAGAAGLSWQGACVALGDMPWVAEETLLALKHMASNHPGAVIAPVFEGRRGHPVIFPAHLFPALELLTGDAGARELLKDAMHCQVADPGILRDVDTPEDLARTGG